MVGRLLLVVALTGLAVSRAVAATDVPVLIYHQIVAGSEQPGETVISVDRFKEQMAFLRERGYTTISVAQLVDFMRGRITVPGRSIVLTFDDGWKNVLSAVPVLDEYQFKASFWIITRLGIGGEYLEWSDIDALARNPRFEVYSHTESHPWDPADNLVTWSEGKVAGKGLEDARRELVESKRKLEQRLGRSIPYLAWPVGWYNEALVETARDAGYEALFSADEGVNAPGDDVRFIKRLFVDGACDIDAFAKLLETGRYEPCAKSPWVTRGHSPTTYSSVAPPR